MVKEDSKCVRQDNPYPNMPASVKESEIIRLLFVAMQHLEDKGYNLVALENMVNDAFAQLLPERCLRHTAAA